MANLRKRFWKMVDGVATWEDRGLTAAPGATFSDSSGRGYRVAKDGSLRRLDKEAARSAGRV